MGSTVIKGNNLDDYRVCIGFCLLGMGVIRVGPQKKYKEGKNKTPKYKGPPQVSHSRFSSLRHQILAPFLCDAHVGFSARFGRHVLLVLRLLYKL